MSELLEQVIAEAGMIDRKSLPIFLSRLEHARSVAFQRLVTPEPARTADELLDIGEASQRLSVGKDWIYRHHRELPFARRVGKRLLFSANGLQQYIESNQP
jgi:excisionase family DNA binding protein